MTPLEKLNSIYPGWSNNGNLYTNPGSEGGIIDFAIVAKSWFLIFNSDEPTRYRLSSIEECIDIYSGVIGSYKEPSVNEVLKLASEIEKLPGRSNIKANIISAYRQLTNKSLHDALTWWDRNND